MNLTEAVKGGGRVPPAIVALSPDAFSDDWANKPKDEVAIGLRLLSDAELRTARAEAAKHAAELFADEQGRIIDSDAMVAEYNDALLRWAVACAATDPNDITQPYFAPAPQDLVTLALTSNGLRRLWDELVRVHVGHGVAHPEVTDDEAEILGAMLSAGELSRLEGPVAIEVRKLLSYCLDRLREAGAEAPDDFDGTPYVVSAAAP